MKKYFFVRVRKSDGSGNKYLKIRFSEISFIESSRDYLHIHFDERNRITYHSTMMRILDFLPKESFQRCHRSFIVNVDNVEIIHNDEVEFSKGQRIPLGEQYKQELLLMINCYKQTSELIHGL